MSTDLAVIKAALKAATESPWFVNAPDRVFVGNRADGRSAGLFEIIYGSDDVLSDLHSAAAVRALANAHLIANAPTWLAELVERVKVAEAAIERVRALADRFKARGFTSVYESALELGEMIADALDGDA